MQLCRFYLPRHGPRLGLVAEQTVYDLTASGLPAAASMAALLAASVTTPLLTLVSGVDRSVLHAYTLAALDVAPDPTVAHLLPPIDRQDVWAAGVTYARSRTARLREAISKDVYERVYAAARPELFFKAAGRSVVGPQDWVGIRGDSAWTVPEPELALVLNPALEIVGYTVGNDVSSRDIEGDNPLYLPQAKIYRHACALGPVMTLAHDGFDAGSLAIELIIRRAGRTLYAGTTSTARLHRSFADLIAYLGRYHDFPDGVCLLTGAGIVPDDEISLRDGDAIAIRIAGIGVLYNVARQL